MDSSIFENIEKIIGYVFCDKSLLDVAITTPSYANDCVKNKDNFVSSNDRLEFLGDSILGFIISEHLYHKGSCKAGDMTDQKKLYVSNVSLVGFAVRIGLVKRNVNIDFTSDYIKLSKNQFLSQKTIADVMEAIIGAIYMDSNISTAREWILQYLLCDNTF